MEEAKYRKYSLSSNKDTKQIDIYKNLTFDKKNLVFILQENGEINSVIIPKNGKCRRITQNDAQNLIKEIFCFKTVSKLSNQIEDIRFKDVTFEIFLENAKKHRKEFNEFEDKYKCKVSISDDGLRIDKSGICLFSFNRQNFEDIIEQIDKVLENLEAIIDMYDDTLSVCSAIKNIKDGNIAEALKNIIYRILYDSIFPGGNIVASMLKKICGRINKRYNVYGKISDIIKLISNVYVENNLKK